MAQIDFVVVILALGIDVYLLLETREYGGIGDGEESETPDFEFIRLVSKRPRRSPRPSAEDHRRAGRRHDPAPRRAASCASHASRVPCQC